MQYHLAVIAMLAIVGCGGPQTTNLAPASSQEVLSQAPNWYLSVPHDSDHLNAVGSATSRDMNTAVEKAKMLARNDLAQQLSTDLGSLTKQFQQETGLGDESQFLTQFSSTIKAVSAEMLLGSRVDEQKLLSEGDIYRAYVLVSLPMGKAKRAFIEHIKEDDELYTRFRATEAFKELERELRNQK